MFIGGGQFALGMIVAEAVYPSYSVSQNYISDLGVGPADSIFNSSVFLLGLLTLVAAYFIQRTFGSRILSVMLVLAGVGAMGVGVFPENSPLMHEIVSDIAFIFAGLAPLAALKVVKKPFTYFSVVMGLLSLSALVLLSAEYSFGLGEQFFLGLGAGGMERMIVYPVLLWETALGGYLMSSSQALSRSKV